jgi:hypothetical protein
MAKKIFQSTRGKSYYNFYHRFEFKFADRMWELKAETEEKKNMWVDSLSLLIIEVQKSKTSDDEETEVNKSRSDSRAGQKNWKANYQSVNTMEILKKSGFTNRDDELSEKALKLKFKSLNPEVPEIRSRIHYGYMLINLSNSQKRWFFIMSSRPLNDVEYEKEDGMIFKNPAGVNLDTLYYYEFENEEDECILKGEIPLMYNFLILGNAQKLLLMIKIINFI